MSKPSSNSRREFLKKSAFAGAAAALMPGARVVGAAAPALPLRAAGPVATASANGLDAVAKALELINSGSDALDAVVSPAMGGVVVGYEMGRQLGVDAMFAERVDGALALRRGFDLAAGARVLMAEDIVTTGKSSRECIDCITANGGRVVAASCLIDRSDGAADLGVPLISLARLAVPAYKPDELPPELAALPAVKPGSRPRPS